MSYKQYKLTHFYQPQCSLIMALAVVCLSSLIRVNEGLWEIYSFTTTKWFPLERSILSTFLVFSMDSSHLSEMYRGNG